MTKKIFAVCSLIFVIAFSVFNSFAMPIISPGNPGNALNTCTIRIHNGVNDSSLTITTPGIEPLYEETITWRTGDRDPDVPDYVTQTTILTDVPNSAMFGYASNFDMYSDSDDISYSPDITFIAENFADGSPTIYFSQSHIVGLSLNVQIDYFNEYGEKLTNFTEISQGELVSSNGYWIYSMPIRYSDYYISSLKVIAKCNFNANQLNAIGDVMPIKVQTYHSSQEDFDSYIDNVVSNTLDADGSTFFSWLGNAVGSFLNFEIIPGFSLGGVFLIMFAFIIVKAVLHYVAGG